MWHYSHLNAIFSEIAVLLLFYTSVLWWVSRQLPSTPYIYVTDITQKAVDWTVNDSVPDFAVSTRSGYLCRHITKNLGLPACATANIRRGVFMHPILRSKCKALVVSSATWWCKYRRVYRVGYHHRVIYSNRGLPNETLAKLVGPMITYLLPCWSVIPVVSW